MTELGGLDLCAVRAAVRSDSAGNCTTAHTALVYVKDILKLCVLLRLKTPSSERKVTKGKKTKPRRHMIKVGFTSFNSQGPFNKTLGLIFFLNTFFKKIVVIPPQLIENVLFPCLIYYFKELNLRAILKIRIYRIKTFQSPQGLLQRKISDHLSILRDFFFNYHAKIFF